MISGDTAYAFVPPICTSALKPSGAIKRNLPPSCVITFPAGIDSVSSNIKVPFLTTMLPLNPASEADEMSSSPLKPFISQSSTKVPPPSSEKRAVFSPKRAAVRSSVPPSHTRITVSSSINENVPENAVVLPDAATTATPPVTVVGVKAARVAPLVRIMVLAT